MLELCAGAGGTAVGIERAGFEPICLVELDKHACATLRINRPMWNIIESDLRMFNAERFRGTVDLLSAGVPCPPFSKAGKQLGANDERDLFPEALRIIDECKPKAIMFENVRGLLDSTFTDYRETLNKSLAQLGYKAFWRLLNASDFGVSQLRPRVVIVALKEEYAARFRWPEIRPNAALTVGELLLNEMSKRGWKKAKEWMLEANKIAPTLVGGSKKHGGPDLGPTRAKRAWKELGVCGMGIADEPPDADYDGLPRLTVKMAALIQGFSTDWEFFGKKTNSYRQVGNAFPPPVAEAVAKQIFEALSTKSKEPRKGIQREFIL